MVRSRAEALVRAGSSNDEFVSPDLESNIPGNMPGQQNTFDDILHIWHNITLHHSELAGKRSCE